MGKLRSKSVGHRYLVGHDARALVSLQHQVMQMNCNTPAFYCN